MNNWEKLSLKAKSELMSIYLKNGITSLDEMKKHYNNFAEGGNTDIPPYWGQPTNKKDSPIDYLSRYVNSQAFARRAPNQSYIKHAKNAVNNFNGVTNSQWREYSIGPHINEYNNTITMYPGRIDTPYAPYEYSFKAPYMTILAHEYGHIIDPNYGKENNVPKSYTDLYKTIIPKADSHDSRPDEIYADLQSLRYQLYENNIFDIINDGTFNESHLDKALKQGVPNRLLYTMPKEAIIQMMNTIADNVSQDAIANIVADGGKIFIKPENRGKFTALKKRTGHSATWFKENGTPAQKKMAVFELNSKKWRK